MDEKYFTKDEFDELWNINPNHLDPTHDYKSTWNYVYQIHRYPRTANDGKLVDLQLIKERYKKHYLIRIRKNKGVEPKFVKKENQILTIFQFIVDAKYMDEEKDLYGDSHFYLFELYTEAEMKNKIDDFLILCSK